jgi:hypothetical protein
MLRAAFVWCPGLPRGADACSRVIWVQAALRLLCRMGGVAPNWGQSSDLLDTGVTVVQGAPDPGAASHCVGPACTRLQALWCHYAGVCTEPDHPRAAPCWLQPG